MISVSADQLMKSEEFQDANKVLVASRQNVRTCRIQYVKAAQYCNATAEKQRELSQQTGQLKKRLVKVRQCDDVVGGAIAC